MNAKLARPTLQQYLNLTAVTPYAEITPDGGYLERLPAQMMRLPMSALGGGTLIVGQSGSGKSTSILNRLIFAALRSQASVCVLDLQAVQLGQVITAARTLRGVSTPIYSILPEKPGKSHRFNPISGANTYDKASQLAEILVDLSQIGKTQSSDGGYFTTQAKLGLTLAIQAVNQLRGNNGTLGEIARVYRMESHQGIRQWASPTQVGGSVHKFFTELTEAGSNGGTTHTQLLNSLSFAMNENVRRISSANDFTMASLMEKPSLIVTSVLENDLRRTRPLLNLLLTHLFDEAIQLADSHNGVLPRPLIVFCDELSLLGPIQDLGHRLNTCRKRGIAFLGAVQTLQQMRDTYPDGEAVIAGFRNQVFCPPLARPDTEWASAGCGYIQTEIANRNAKGGYAGGSTVMLPMLPPSELSLAHKDDALGPRFLWMLNQHRPFWAHVKACYKIKSEHRFDKPSKEEVIDSLPDRAVRLRLDHNQSGSRASTLIKITV